MREAQTALVKYVFLDVVGFTHKRSVEAQTDIVDTLNNLVRESLSDTAQELDSIFLPTGDGMCIALIAPESEWDVHLRLALEILARVERYNQSTEDTMRKFEIRIGLNENVDNLVTDINGSRNIAGSGINIAQRVMNFADGSQILVGAVVHERLSCRERYMNSFRAFHANLKHGSQITLHQFKEEGHEGVSVNVPSHFVQKATEERPFTDQEAYFVGYAIKHEAYIASINRGQRDYAAAIALYFMSCDAVERKTAKRYETPYLRTHGAGKLPFEQVLEYYMSTDSSVCCALADAIQRQLDYVATYSETPFTSAFIFPSDKGKDKFKRERPDIWDELDLENAI